MTEQKKIETLHAPHGANWQMWPCPKCAAEFPALFLLTRHTREKHEEPRGLARS
jgi:hypothetical protein